MAIGQHYRMDGSPYTGTRMEILMEWGQDLEDGPGRIIGQTLLWNGQWVSTVWLGLDHGWNSPRPLIFETMVFDHLNPAAETDLVCRYATLREATEGHREACRAYAGIWYSIRQWWAYATAEEEEWE